MGETNKTINHEASLNAAADISPADAIQTAKGLFLRNCNRYTTAANRAILKSGDHAENIYLLIEGSATVTMEDSSGRELVLYRIYDGIFFGEQQLFNPEESNQTWVTTREECEIGEMSYRQFRLLANQHPELLLAVSSQLSSRLQHCNTKLLDLAFLDVTARILRTLTEMTNEPDALTNPKGRTVVCSRQGIAKLVGCSREMASRVLKKLEERGDIISHGKHILIYQHALKSQQDTQESLNGRTMAGLSAF